MTDAELVAVLHRHLSWTDEGGRYKCLCNPAGPWMQPLEYSTHLADVTETWMLEHSRRG